ncbi:MAG: sirohydrochlorin chelatase [Acidimicrobiales bacterium]
MNPPVTGDDPALLLIGHGTRSEAGVAQYFEIAGKVSAVEPNLALGTGFIELVRPTVAEAIDDLVDRGVRSVVGVPLVLLGAGHLKNDGPAALGHGRQRHHEVSFSYARQLGLHPSVLSVVEERINQALDRLDWASPRPPERGSGSGSETDGPDGSDTSTIVVVVGRGSSDPDANSDLYKAARLLSDSRRLPLVEPAFVSLARPSVPEALERATRLGARRVAVVPDFLFTGVLPDRIGIQAAEWSDGHPEVAVEVGGEIGPDPRIAALILERYREALGAHPPAMNCDMCLYRQGLPGYEDKVGLNLAAAAHDHNQGGHNQGGHGRHV